MLKKSSSLWRKMLEIKRIGRKNATAAEPVTISGNQIWIAGIN